MEVLTNFVNRSYLNPKVPNKTNREPPNTGFDLFGGTKCSVIGVVVLPFGCLHLQEHTIVCDRLWTPKGMAMALHALPPLVKVAVAQMTAISDTNANFITCARLVQVHSHSLV